MKLIATLGPRLAHGCRKIRLEIESGEGSVVPDRYTAGELIVREHHAEPLLRLLDGSSGVFIDVEVRA